MRKIHTLSQRAITLTTFRTHSRNMCLPPVESRAISPNLDFSPKCDEAIKEKLQLDMQIHQDFISLAEEENLLEELELKFKRSRYQYDHWDDVQPQFLALEICPTVKWPSFVLFPILFLSKAIHGYRETEKPTWNEKNSPVIVRLRNFAFTNDSTVMQHVHVLDLAENGHIKPHLDSIKVNVNN